ncbi:hypothetical protein KJB35_04910 [Vibrio sp. D431a]|nr:hypothetical protein [Vibrio sp. D431a]
MGNATINDLVKDLDYSPEHLQQSRKAEPMNSKIGNQSASIMELLNKILEASELGLIAGNQIKVGDLHKIAEIHCLEKYGEKIPSLIDLCGEEVAEKLLEPSWKSLQETKPENTIGGHYLVKITNDVVGESVTAGIMSLDNFYSETQLRMGHRGRPFFGVTHWMEYPEGHEAVFVIDGDEISRDEAFDILREGGAIANVYEGEASWMVNNKDGAVCDNGEWISNLEEHLNYYSRKHYESGWFKLINIRL